MRDLIIKLTVIAAMILSLPQSLFCRSLPDESASDSAQIIVSLLTCAPGSEIYELEGHSALRIETPDGGDAVVNWGLFNFDAPNFVYRFVKGETDYRVGVAPTAYFLESYRRQGRRVLSQRLNLTQEQAERLIELIQINLLPENCVYRYNYVYDNCATRPLKMIESAIGDSVSLGVPSPTASVENPTFRRVMTSYHRNYPWYQFGIDLALGSGIDKPISKRELTFSPEALAALLDQSTIPDQASDKTKPLVTAQTIVVEGVGESAAEGPTPWWLSPMAVCWAFFIVALLITIADWRRRRVSKWFDAMYFTIVGLTGCLVFFLVYISVHEATSPNWLQLWLNPLALLVPILIWLKKSKCVLISYQIVNFALLLTLLIAWGCHAQQLNPAFLPLILTDLMRSASYIRLTR